MWDWVKKLLIFIISEWNALLAHWILVRKSEFRQRKYLHSSIDSSFPGCHMQTENSSFTPWPCCTLCWAADQIKSKYNGLTSWGIPWERHCFDTAYIQTLLRLIPTVTGLQCQPKYCHIWENSLRDHALWPRGKRMVKKPTLRCPLSACFSSYFPSFVPCMACQIHSACASIAPPCMWVAVEPPLPSRRRFHQPSLLHDPIYYWNQSSTPPPYAPQTQAQPSPGPGTPAPHPRS